MSDDLVGRRVLIKPNSYYYGTNIINPADTVGTVVGCFGGDLCQVNWDNETTNGYPRDALVVLPIQKEVPDAEPTIKWVNTTPYLYMGNVRVKLTSDATECLATLRVVALELLTAANLTEFK